MENVQATEQKYHKLPPKTPAIKVTKLWWKNLRATKPVVLNKGGARSSKSYSIAQLFIAKFTEERNKKFLVTRKTMPSLRRSTYRLIVSLLKQYDYYKFCEHNKAECVIRFRDNIMDFCGLDDPEKIKSTDYHYIWMEEANEYSWDDYIIVRLRLSAPTPEDEPNRMFLSFNPSDDHGYIAQKLDGKDPDVEVIHSTFEDNIFLSEEYKKILRDLRQKDYNAYLIYAEGKYGSRKGLIYEPFFEIDEMLSDLDDIIYGLDFGYNNPSALIEVGIKNPANIYLRERIYEISLTTPMLIDRMKHLAIDPYALIYADSAEPDRIEEIKKAGFHNIKPCEKGPGSVRSGILFCKTFKIHTLPENANIDRERGRYSWKIDRSGNVLDEPVDFDNHAMDAIRYALWTHRKNIAATETWEAIYEPDESDGWSTPIDGYDPWAHQEERGW